MRPERDPVTTVQVIQVISEHDGLEIGAMSYGNRHVQSGSAALTATKGSDSIITPGRITDAIACAHTTDKFEDLRATR